MARREGQRYVARGKKTIAHLAGEARKSGEERIGVIEERGGRMAVLCIIRIDERGRWAWEEERLLNSTEKTGSKGGPQ